MILLALFIQSAAPTASCQVFSNGPTVGLCAGKQTTKYKGLYVIDVLPGPKPPPPLPAESAAIVDSLLAAYDRGEAGLPPELLGAAPTEIFCPGDPDAACLVPKPLKGWSLPRGYTHQRPALLEDGRIRIEWLKDGKLRYLSMLTFIGGKLWEIDTASAEVPVMDGAPD